MAIADTAPEARKRPVAGVGRVIGWPGGSLWIGRQIGAIQDHAHHAIQVSLALEGDRFRIQADGWPEWRETRGAIVMPDRRHRLDGCGGALATLFVEPSSRRGAEGAVRGRRRRAADGRRSA